MHAHYPHPYYRPCVCGVVYCMHVCSACFIKVLPIRICIWRDTVHVISLPLPRYKMHYIMLILTYMTARIRSQRTAHRNLERRWKIQDSILKRKLSTHSVQYVEWGAHICARLEFQM